MNFIESEYPQVKIIEWFICKCCGRMIRSYINLLEKSIELMCFGRNLQEPCHLYGTDKKKCKKTCPLEVETTREQKAHMEKYLGEWITKFLNEGGLRFVKENADTIALLKPFFHKLQFREEFLFDDGMMCMLATWKETSVK